MSKHILEPTYMFEMNGEWIRPKNPSGDTMLEAIKDGNIFSIKKLDDGRFGIEEEGGNFFSVTLTKDQLIYLANELLSLSEGP